MLGRSFEFHADIHSFITDLVDDSNVATNHNSIKAHLPKSQFLNLTKCLVFVFNLLSTTFQYRLMSSHVLWDTFLIPLPYEEELTGEPAGTLPYDA